MTEYQIIWYQTLKHWQAFYVLCYFELTTFITPPPSPPLNSPPSDWDIIFDNNGMIVHNALRCSTCNAHTLNSNKTQNIHYYSFCYSKREGHFLFNDALNTFYLRLYGVGHMVKDHSDSERGNPLPPHGLLFPISSKGSFICTIPQTW